MKKKNSQKRLDVLAKMSVLFDAAVIGACMMMNDLPVWAGGILGASALIMTYAMINFCREEEK